MPKPDVFDFNLFRALEVFAAIVETRHMTRAAKMIGMTQSAASQHLKNLEVSLGAQLIDRSLRPLQLTKAGIVLHRRTLHILGEVDRLRADIRRAHSTPLPLLRIAMLASIATTLAPALSSLARNRFEIPEISLSAGLSRDHHQLLRSRQADLTITSSGFYELEDLVRHPIIKERYLLITPKGFAGPVDDLTELSAQIPLVRFTRESAVGMQTDRHLQWLRLELPRAMEGDRSSVVLAPVAAGLGYAILTPTLLIDGLTEGMEIDVHELPIPTFSRNIMLVARRNELGELPMVFAERCAEVLRETIDSRLPQLGDDCVLVLTGKSPGND